MRRLPLLFVVLAGCSVNEVIADDPEGDPGELSGAAFNKDSLVADSEFFAPDQMDAAAVQRFLERLPSGKASYLAQATVTHAGKATRFADALASEARGAGISPLVLLATLQKESGLVSTTGQPSARALAAAFGCGCPDGSPCSAEDAGLGKQLSCAAEVFAKNGAALRAGRSTVSGWKVGVAKQDVDRITVTPATRGTALLYTYTPLVRSNKLFYSVYSGYRARLPGAPPPTAPPTAPPTTQDMQPPTDMPNQPNKDPDMPTPSDMLKALDMSTPPDLLVATPPDLASVPDLGSAPDLAQFSPDLAVRDAARPIDLARPVREEEPVADEREEAAPRPGTPSSGCSAAGGAPSGMALFGLFFVALALLRRGRVSDSGRH